MPRTFTVEAITKTAPGMPFPMFKVGDRSIATSSNGDHPTMTFRASLVPIGAPKRILMPNESPGPGQFDFASRLVDFASELGNYHSGNMAMISECRQRLSRA